MTSKFSPRSLNLRALAQHDTPFSGTDPLHEYERLSEETRGLEADSVAKPTVDWTARAELRQGPAGAEQIWLHLTADATIALTCQRCLQPVGVPLATDRWFRFVADEATAEAEDADVEEDLLVLTPSFDLLELVEDELLMDVPLVPAHELCLVDLPREVADEGAPTHADDRPNPFAVLSGLKTGRPN